MTSADKLYQIAIDKTRPLTATERRRVIAYLEEIGELSKMGKREIARMFDVDVNVINKDMMRMLKKFAGQLSTERAMEFVARFLVEHETLVNRAKAALCKTPCGSLAEQQYLRILSDLEDRKLKVMQGVGLVPKELGHLTVQEERWVAQVDDQGIPSVQEDKG